MVKNTSNQKKTKIKALISDIDRTLLNTEEFIFQAFVHTLKTHKIPAITKTDLHKMMGLSLEKTYGILAPHHNVSDLTETHRSFQERNLHLSIPFPNTLNTLKQLNNRGIKIAAVTTRSKRTAQKTLELSGLLPFISTVIFPEDVSPEELKPHPRPLLLALERLHIAPSQSLSIGDTREDIEAGIKAGTITIGVTYGSHGETIKLSQPDYVIDDIAQLLSLIDKNFQTI